MSVILSQKMVLTPKAAGASGKPLMGWRNYINRGNITADYEDQYWPVSNLGNSNTALYWRSTSLEEQALEIDIGGGLAVDYIAIARHNLGTSFCEIRVDAVVAGDEQSGYVNLVDGQMLGSDKPAIIHFTEVYPSKLRVTLIPQEALPRIAILYVGKLTVMTKGMAQETVPVPFSYVTEVATGRAESGDFLGRIITDQTRELNFSFEMVEYDWFKEEFGEFAQVSLTQPFFFSWLPKIYPDEVGFGWLNTDIMPQASHFTGGVQVNFNLDITAIA